MTAPAWKVAEAMRDIERIARIEEKLDVVRARLNELMEWDEVDRLYAVAGMLGVLRMHAEWELGP